MQPILGMSIVVAAVWAAQLFVVGLPMWIAGLGAIGGAASMVGAYFAFYHVRSRFDRSSIRRRATATRSTPRSKPS